MRRFAIAALLVTAVPVVVTGAESNNGNSVIYEVQARRHVDRAVGKISDPGLGLPDCSKNKSGRQSAIARSRPKIADQSRLVEISARHSAYRLGQGQC